MRNLQQMIDNMRAVSFPEYFTSTDRENVLQAISIARQRAKPYDGDFTADWLLSDFEAVEWITRNNGREEFVDGCWKNTINVNWNVQLCNRKSLITPEYSHLLEANRTISWLHRSGFFGEGIALSIWRSATRNQLLYTRWVVLNEARFQPEKYAFKLVDQNSVSALFRSIARGGWFEALQIPARFLSALYSALHSKECPQEIYGQFYNLPQKDVEDSIMWLKENNFYIKVTKGEYKGRTYLDRKKVADLISEPYYILKVGNKANCFFRQFEPDFNHTLLLSVIQKTEFPDQKTKKIDDVVNETMSEGTITYIANVFRGLLVGHRQVPDYLPEPGLVSIRRATSEALAICRRSSHHLFIPVSVGLSYLNHAMGLVHVHGDAIVDLFLAAYAERQAIIERREGGQSQNEVNDIGNIYDLKVDDKIKNICKSMGICVFRRDEEGATFYALRSSPSLEESLHVLVGACIVCIAITKPSRETELTHLRRNCLEKGASGFFLNFTLGKSNNQDAKRPIPVITAKAIQLLQKLGEMLCKLNKDKRKISQNLFYIPNLKDGGAMIANAVLLNRMLDAFCDYIALPIDDLGRRWYIRIHEMRKWFLLLLFWSGRYDVLDAIRWAAGHTDAKHAYEYIESECPGEELPNLEAEYAITRLKEFDLESDKNPENGLESLYGSVLRHFGVQSLSMIPEAEWFDYITTLRKTEGFHLEPHTVYGVNQEVVGLTISFVLRELNE